MKTTTQIRRFFTKVYNQKTSFAWFNTKLVITENEIKELQEYINKNDKAKEIIIVKNIEETRPQRTWGGMPEWFRPNSYFSSFNNYNYNNSFIFAIFEEFDKREIEEAIKSLPNKSEVIRLG